LDIDSKILARISIFNALPKGLIQLEIKTKYLLYRVHYQEENEDIVVYIIANCVNILSFKLLDFVLEDRRIYLNKKKMKII